MNVWRLMQGQRREQWPGQLAELESELETRLESKPVAELPSALSELCKEKQCIKKKVTHYIDK